MANFKELYKLTLFLRQNPERHDQETWARRDPVCGTVCCAAGWEVVNHGFKLDFEGLGRTEATFILDQYDQRIPNPRFIPSDVAGYGYDYRYDNNGQSEFYSISEKARELLDLTDEQANELFAGDAGDVYDLERIIDRWYQDKKAQKAIKKAKAALKSARANLESVRAGNNPIC